MAPGARHRTGLARWLPIVEASERGDPPLGRNPHQGGQGVEHVEVAVGAQDQPRDRFEGHQLQPAVRVGPRLGDHLALVARQVNAPEGADGIRLRPPSFGEDHLPGVIRCARPRPPNHGGHLALGRRDRLHLDAGGGAGHSLQALVIGHEPLAQPPRCRLGGIGFGIGDLGDVFERGSAAGLGAAGGRTEGAGQTGELHRWGHGMGCLDEAQEVAAVGVLGAARHHLRPGEELINSLLGVPRCGLVQIARPGRHGLGHPRRQGQFVVHEGKHERVHRVVPRQAQEPPPVERLDPGLQVEQSAREDVLGFVQRVMERAKSQPIRVRHQLLEQPGGEVLQEVEHLAGTVGIADAHQIAQG